MVGSIIKKLVGLKRFYFVFLEILVYFLVYLLCNCFDWFKITLWKVLFYNVRSEFYRFILVKILLLENCLYWSCCLRKFINLLMF